MFLASLFMAATLAAFISLALWYPTAAIFGACAALIGAVAAWLLLPQKDYSQAEQAAALPIKEPESRAAYTKAERALSRVALLDATMNSMREGMLMVDDSMIVVSSNRAARDIFKSVSGPFEPRRLTEVTRNPSVHQAFNAALKRGERAEVKVEVNGVGERRTFDLRVAPLASSGEQSLALGIFFDITRLERLERVRQEFLSNVSHELRTPLTAIIAFIETLEDGAIDDPADNRRFLSVIRKNAARMHNLIDDILELSAIEAGTVTVEPQPVPLRSLVEDVMTSLASHAQGSNVTLHNEVSEDAVVYAEARRLEQMLTNLVDNAIKFNREGGSVRVHHQAGEARDRIYVEDTGEGISSEYLPRIFERFYQVDRARSRAMGGTGLGLAIVKHLARAHGGEATVQSEPGTGTTFTLELPRGDDR
jgi:two-component system phosphate regulon sensor histidine kinase PhoR